MRPLTIVTTSWDDGDPCDMRVAELLAARGLRSTFYVPTKSYGGRRLLDRAHLRNLTRAGFEVGAHSISHRDLTALAPADLASEVSDSRKILEDSLGLEVATFCYPGGRYNQTVIQKVRDAGYKGARSTRMLSVSDRFQPYEMPTTVQAYPHNFAAYCRNAIRACSGRAVITSLLKRNDLNSWPQIALSMFKDVCKSGGVWHLYGHSWEIAGLNLWPELERVLDHVARRDGVVYATNAELLALRSGLTPIARLFDSHTSHDVKEAAHGAGRTCLRR